MESRIQEALQYLEENPDAKVATVAREFGVPRTRLRRRLQGVGPLDSRPPTNTRLTDPEEAALCRYVDRLDRINLAVRPAFITDAANHILASRASQSEQDSPPTVGQNWTSRFIQRHEYLKQTQKKLNSNRQRAENPAVVAEYFEKLYDTLEEYGIVQEDIWNMDETGFRIGIGKDQVVVTKRKRAHYFGIPENRESATDIEAISIGGRVIPAFLILSGQIHMAYWYQQAELEDNIAIITSATGYSNDEISLEWLKHFDTYTKAGTVGRYRLLIFDGHGSYCTWEFVNYCEHNNIIPFGLLPHLIHLVQPLDVIVFQPLKHYYTQALDILVRDGITNITKVEFLSVI
jgi:hypothetical protein